MVHRRERGCQKKKTVRWQVGPSSRARTGSQDLGWKRPPAAPRGHVAEGHCPPRACRSCQQEAVLQVDPWTPPQGPRPRGSGSGSLRIQQASCRHPRGAEGFPCGSRRNPRLSHGALSPIWGRTPKPLTRELIYRESCSGMNYSSHKHFLAGATSSGLRPGRSPLFSTASPGGWQVVAPALSPVAPLRRPGPERCDCVWLCNTRDGTLGSHGPLWVQQPRPAEGSAAADVKDVATCDLTRASGLSQRHSRALIGRRPKHSFEKTDMPLSSVIYNSQDTDAARCPSVDEWVRMGCAYTMEFYPAIKSIKPCHRDSLQAPRGHYAK